MSNVMTFPYFTMEEIQNKPKKFEFANEEEINTLFTLLQDVNSMNYYHLRLYRLGPLLFLFLPILDRFLWNSKTIFRVFAINTSNKQFAFSLSYKDSSNTKHQIFDNSKIDPQSGYSVDVSITINHTKISAQKTNQRFISLFAYVKDLTRDYFISSYYDFYIEDYMQDFLHQNLTSDRLRSTYFLYMASKPYLSPLGIIQVLQSIFNKKQWEHIGYSKKAIKNNDPEVINALVAEIKTSRQSALEYLKNLPTNLFSIYPEEQYVQTLFSLTSITHDHKLKRAVYTIPSIIPSSEQNNIKLFFVTKNATHEENLQEFSLKYVNIKQDFLITAPPNEVSHMEYTPNLAFEGLEGQFLRGIYFRQYKSSLTNTINYTLRYMLAIPLAALIWGTAISFWIFTLYLLFAGDAALLDILKFPIRLVTSYETSFPVGNLNILITDRIFCPNCLKLTDHYDSKEKKWICDRCGNEMTPNYELLNQEINRILS